ncbi:hypothetical protein Rsub_06624 [Raphidocelis subcapitata]|uniref:Uncharacterized protein n=1 Tax=Raphidocelis subcapitata TaxID=307507 RepID=A0A2V0P0T9_9CHLO|nr:hypothetical protein Rsub_06624 [Raphidocelis subcapitata]|eukprot:GBF93491.1 hypothetical protein Rsub_06624 [Raphidocelis subcapitata]
MCGRSRARSGGVARFAAVIARRYAEGPICLPGDTRKHKTGCPCGCCPCVFHSDRIASPGLRSRNHDSIQSSEERARASSTSSSAPASSASSCAAACCSANSASSHAATAQPAPPPPRQPQAPSAGDSQSPCACCDSCACIWACSSCSAACCSSSCLCCSACAACSCMSARSCCSRAWRRCSSSSRLWSCSLSWLSLITLCRRASSCAASCPGVGAAASPCAATPNSAAEGLPLLLSDSERCDSSSGSGGGGSGALSAAAAARGGADAAACAGGGSGLTAPPSAHVPELSKLQVHPPPPAAPLPCGSGDCGQPK